MYLSHIIVLPTTVDEPYQRYLHVVWWEPAIGLLQLREPDVDIGGFTILSTHATLVSAVAEVMANNHGPNN